MPDLEVYELPCQNCKGKLRQHHATDGKCSDCGAVWCRCVRCEEVFNLYSIRDAYSLLCDACLLKTAVTGKWWKTLVLAGGGNNAST